MNGLAISALLLAVMAPAAIAQEDRVAITEFMAGNQHTLKDAYGDSPDWIELQNGGGSQVNLAGWRLTDDPARLDQWIFPGVTLPPGGFLVVLASGRGTADTNGQLHASFQLASAGEYLALVKPDGTTIVSEFTFAAQYPDVSFGLGRQILTNRLVPLGAAARIRVPADGLEGWRWTGSATTEPFDDSASAGWTPAITGVGYESGSTADPFQPMGFWNFDNATNASLALDASGKKHHGAILGAQYTADAKGRTGLPGDRALDFGLGGAGARVEVADAAKGVFDSAAIHNALTVSLWILGASSQPANASVFWFSENADGGGARAAQAHLPWGDSVIYWDTGNGSDCCGESARMFKADPDPAHWKGRWNHYVLLKNGSRKEIWQNGGLFHCDENNYHLAVLHGLTIGAMPGGSASYAGLMDDFAIWDQALSIDQIRALAMGASPLALSSLKAFIATDVAALMHNLSPSVYLRIPFQFQPPAGFDSLQLRIQYNAGFIAYINGAEVARRNAPASASFDSSATGGRSRAKTLEFEEIDLPGAATLLHAGANILALHGLNASATNADFLLRPELVPLKTFPRQYLPQPTPGAPNGLGVTGFVAQAKFSQPHGLYTSPLETTIQIDTPGATLVYTTNSSAPSLTNGTSVAAASPEASPSTLVRLSHATIVRAAGFKPGFEPGAPAACTYLFPADAERQPVRPTGLPATWPDGYQADYAMDQRIVTNALPGYGISEALRAIPSVSIAMDPQDLFAPANGIYANATQRGAAWERAASAEWILPDGGTGWQINCGARMYGNISRQNDFTPKHSVRLVFKSQYGPASLKFPLFLDSPVDRFDEIVFKGLSTDTWPCVEWGAGADGFLRWQRRQASYIRDQWVRDTQLAMGQPASHGAFVHLYLNGLYWGLYNLVEHPDVAFLSDYLGGAKEDYDVIKDFVEVVAGSSATWDQAAALATAGFSTEAAYQRIQGNWPDGARNPAYPVYLDMDNLIDYMILHIAIGADDWPNHNWWAARRKGPESQGFKFFAWDQEISNNSTQRTTTSWGPRYEEVDAFNTPAYFYSRLRPNASFRLRFADRVQRHFFNGGALTTEANEQRWLARSREIGQAVVAESARWGDSQRASPPYKREVEWLANETWMHGYWPQMRNLALQRFRNVSLVSLVGAPAFLPPGGKVPQNFALTMTHTNAGAAILYTRDGSDPRRPDDTLNPLAETFTQPLVISNACTLRARAKYNGRWSAITEAIFLPAPDLTSHFTIQQIQAGNSQIQLSFPAEPGASYFLQYRPSLSEGAWLYLPTPIQSAPNGLLSILLDRQTNAPSGFYRVICTY